MMPNAKLLPINSALQNTDIMHHGRQKHQNSTQGKINIFQQICKLLKFAYAEDWLEIGHFEILFLWRH